MLSWSSFGLTNTGKVRKHNEDSFLERSEIGLWAVADGMGGHDKGDIASQMIINALKKIHEGTTLPRYIDDIEDRLMEVNQKLLTKAQSTSRQMTIGSTVVIMLAYQQYCTYIWAGDSRLYRFRNGRLLQITTDHSQVEFYVAQGIISREEALIHPHGNMITRAVGAMDELHLDMDIQRMEVGDRYLLCSDGLTKHISDLELQRIMQGYNAENTCKELINQTLARGATDNVTAVVVDIG